MPEYAEVERRIMRALQTLFKNGEFKELYMPTEIVTGSTAVAYNDTDGTTIFFASDAEKCTVLDNNSWELLKTITLDDTPPDAMKFGFHPRATVSQTCWFQIWHNDILIGSVSTSNQYVGTAYATYIINGLKKGDTIVLKGKSTGVSGVKACVKNFRILGNVKSTDGVTGS
ncbi:MAG: hypothetical protein JRC93_09145 [Deltaproteobacteria bacterium]|nr:hypothetical protein [Deltaproteobacteria bacterium]